jgi:hypothetical protein
MSDQKSTEVPGSYDLMVYPEYFQFYLQDAREELDIAEEWEGAEETFVVATGRVLGVRTARDQDSPVTIEISDMEPDEDLDEWDHVVDCSIEIPSGELIVSGPTEDLYHAQRIQLMPGIYCARVYFGMLEEVDDDGFEGDDFYKVTLWPSGEHKPMKVRKAWIPNSR